MPGPSKVVVLDPDARASRQVQLGFEREGIATVAVAADAARLPPPEDTGLVVVGGVDGQGIELLGRARSWLDGNGVDAPIVFAGRGVAPDEATAAGADEAMRPPAYLRDVVTIGRLLRGLPAGRRHHLVGNLIDVTAVFTLVRALSALGRSATLTLVRGLRRGEVRFYHGEVTSAHVGMIHGQAALHQLLLWTDARFDFHHENVVRRHQIPMTPDELFADAERFLAGVRDSAGGLSPAMVLEQNVSRVQVFGRQIPTEVYGVLRMFDGHHTLADVLEDSPYRVFETLRVAQRAVEVGLLRVVVHQPRRPSWRAILPIEHWLVGNEPRGAAEAAPAAAPSAPPPSPTTERDARAPEPQGAQGKSARKRKKKKKRRADTPPAVAIRPAAPEIDWGALIPRTVGTDVGPLAGVIPASIVSGEIVAAPARAQRSMAADDPDVVVEPTIVFDEAAELARDAEARTEVERAEAERHAAERAHAEPGAGKAERPDTERLSASATADAVRAAMELAAAEADRRAAQARRPDTERMTPSALAEARRVAAEHAETDLRLRDSRPEQDRAGAPADDPAAHPEPAAVCPGRRGAGAAQCPRPRPHPDRGRATDARVRGVAQRRRRAGRCARRRAVRWRGPPPHHDRRDCAGAAPPAERAARGRPAQRRDRRDHDAARAPRDRDPAQRAVDPGGRSRGDARRRQRDRRPRGRGARDARRRVTGARRRRGPGPQRRRGVQRHRGSVLPRRPREGSSGAGTPDRVVRGPRRGLSAGRVLGAAAGKTARSGCARLRQARQARQAGVDRNRRAAAG
ncbi:MAG: DUF4388 domain-containing protein [Deltaproteobacteria bacterium]|nr:MAG: DUF4388 domain-containing protein [Deltaproteobacteria bacterium]